jgi:hypothetical protein
VYAPAMAYMQMLRPYDLHCDPDDLHRDLIATSRSR